MSLEFLKTIANNIEKIQKLHFYALKYTHKTNESEFQCCNIHFNDDNDLKNLFYDCFDYISSKKFPHIERIDEYSGFNGDTILSKISLSNPLIAEQYQKIKTAYTSSSNNINVLEFNANAYIFEGKLSLDEKEYSIITLTAKKPFKKLKKSFSLFAKNEFKPFTKKILQLSNTIDILIIEDKLYLLNFSGESILNLEKSYKKKCSEDLEIILSQDIISDSCKELFQSTALHGHNPRKFLTFQQNRLDALSQRSMRKKISRKFNIPLDERTGKFTFRDEKEMEKLIKVLCDKAALDPFDNAPREALNLREWN